MDRVTGDQRDASKSGDRGIEVGRQGVTGVVKTTGRPEVPLSNSTFDATTRTVKMEAAATNQRSGTASNTSSKENWTERHLTGSWNHDNTKGDFKLTKK